MAFRFVNSGGNVVEPVVVNLPVSGVVGVGLPVAIVRAGTGGAMVEGDVGVDTSRTALFGVSLDYRIGASDTFARVIPFNSSQLWEVDCANAATTAQIGIGQYLSATRGYVHNQTTHVEAINRVFVPVAMTGSTSGSGKLIGFFSVVQGGLHGT